MVNRRSLVEEFADNEGIDPTAAADFVYNEKTPKAASPSTRQPQAKSPTVEETPAPPPLPPSVVAAAQVSSSSPLTGVGRVPIGARVRTELASALKRASLERQLKGIQPFAIQEILEEAVELWLLKNGLPLR
jgi:hypothetical protein